MKIISLFVFLSSTIAACGSVEKSKTASVRSSAPAPAETSTGKDGAPGKDGVDGAPGKDGAAGAGLLGVYAHNKLIGYYAGRSEVELLSGVLGYFRFLTGESTGLPVTLLPGRNDDLLVSFFSYTTPDCTGTPWVPLVGDVSNGISREEEGALAQGFIVIDGKDVWRVDGDEALSDPQMVFVSRRVINGKECYPTQPASIFSAALKHKETLPPGITLPFGKLTIRKVP